jgi:hypothetical protein
VKRGGGVNVAAHHLQLAPVRFAAKCQKTYMGCSPHGGSPDGSARLWPGNYELDTLKSHHPQRLQSIRPDWL